MSNKESGVCVHLNANKEKYGSTISRTKNGMCLPENEKCEIIQFCHKGFLNCRVIATICPIWCRFIQLAHSGGDRSMSDVYTNSWRCFDAVSIFSN